MEQFIVQPFVKISLDFSSKKTQKLPQEQLDFTNFGTQAPNSHHRHLDYSFSNFLLPSEPTFVSPAADKISQKISSKKLKRIGSYNISHGATQEQQKPRLDLLLASKNEAEKQKSQQNTDASSFGCESPRGINYFEFKKSV